MPDEKTQQTSEEKKQFTFMRAFAFASEFGFVIALPIIGLGLVGKWIDQKRQTKYFVLLGILLAITVSTIWIAQRLKGIMKDLKK